MSANTISIIFLQLKQWRSRFSSSRDTAIYESESPSNRMDNSGLISGILEPSHSEDINPDEYSSCSSFSASTPRGMASTVLLKNSEDLSNCFKAKNSALDKSYFDKQSNQPNEMQDSTMSTTPDILSFGIGSSTIRKLSDSHTSMGLLRGTNTGVERDQTIAPSTEDKPEARDSVREADKNTNFHCQSVARVDAGEVVPAGDGASEVGPAGYDDSGCPVTDRSTGFLSFDSGRYDNSGQLGQSDRMSTQQLNANSKSNVMHNSHMRLMHKSDAGGRSSGTNVSFAGFFKGGNHDDKPRNINRSKNDVNDNRQTPPDKTSWLRCLEVYPGLVRKSLDYFPNKSYETSGSDGSDVTSRIKECKSVEKSLLRLQRDLDVLKRSIGTRPTLTSYNVKSKSRVSREPVKASHDCITSSGTEADTEANSPLKQKKGMHSTCRRRLLDSSLSYCSLPNAEQCSSRSLDRISRFSSAERRKRSRSCPRPGKKFNEYISTSLPKPRRSRSGKRSR